MQCWVSKQGKKGVWSSFLREFLGLALSKLKFKKKLRVGYVYKEESWIFLKNLTF